jgi:hypothetical protein
MWNKPTRVRVLVTLLLLAIYVALLLRGSTESARRSLQLNDETQAADHISVSILVTSANPVSQELTAQLGFRIYGAIAQDEVTPAEDLKLLINNVGGQQEYDFPKGRRMNRIEVAFPLNGDLNRYPFDRYETTLRLLIATPGGNAQAPVPNATDSGSPDVVRGESLAVGALALRQNIPIPLSLRLSASIPGVKFSGNMTHEANTQITRTALKFRRADNLISVSILINLVMTCLALSVLALALRATTGNGENNLVPLSLSISLIFGLPALRSVQPGVPPVGAFTDYVTFIWAELIVAFSAIITVWHWLLRSDPVKQT